MKVSAQPNQEYEITELARLWGAPIQIFVRMLKNVKKHQDPDFETG